MSDVCCASMIMHYFEHVISINLGKALYIHIPPNRPDFGGTVPKFVLCPAIPI